jgi:hypothetical protein
VIKWKDRMTPGVHDSNGSIDAAVARPREPLGVTAGGTHARLLMIKSIQP